jgi:hypothetical protein
MEAASASPAQSRNGLARAWRDLGADGVKQAKGRRLCCPVASPRMEANYRVKNEGLAERVVMRRILI